MRTGRTLPAAGLCFVLGAALLVLFEALSVRLAGVVLLFAFIAVGAFGLLGHENLAGTTEADDGSEQEIEGPHAPGSDM